MSAHHLFAEQGYAATGMTQIAHHANLSTGALYHHWATKQDVLAAVVSQMHRRLAEQVSTSAVGDGVPLQQLEQAAEVFLRQCADPGFARVMLIDGPAVLGDLWEQLDRRWWLLPTRELLTRAAAAGDVECEDLELLAVAFLGGLSALGRRIALHPHLVSDTAVLEVLRTLVPGRRS